MIPILYQDDHLLVVDKPHDLLTTPGRGPDKQDCLISRILVDYPNARIIHRLDMATSGIVILALNYAAQVAMGKLFEQRLVEKVYIAVVQGQLAEPEGEVNLPLICDWVNRPRQKVCFETGKAAYTRYTCLQYDRANHCTRVKLEPKTGRSHQLRVHMMAQGSPILGDYFYASEEAMKKSDRLLLHAHQISFINPLTQQPLLIESTVPF